MIQQTIGTHSPSFAQAMCNLASLFSSEGDFYCALPLHQRCAQLRRTCLGDDHPDTLQSLHNVADTVFHMGQYYRALSLYDDYIRSDSPFMEARNICEGMLSLQRCSVMFRSRS